MTLPDAPWSDPPDGPDTLGLIASRHATRSRPGHRADEHRLALVIEGGSSRSTYSSGMVVAIEELGLLDVFDAVYGSSAGALNGAWLLSGRAGASMHAWWDEAIMRRAISPRRALRGGPVVDTDYLVNTVYDSVVPMDFEAVIGHPASFHPIATDTLTGAATDLHDDIVDPRTLQLALRATTCMPLLAGPPVPLGGRTYVDGGLAETVPVPTAVADGATHVLALRTRRAGEPSRPPNRVEMHVVSAYLRTHAPGARRAWLHRNGSLAIEERLIADHPGVVEIRPPAHGPTIHRTARTPSVLRRAVELGRLAALEVLGPAAGATGC